MRATAVRGRTNFNLSTGQLSEEYRLELASDGAESVAREVCFARNSNSVFSPWDSGLELHLFLHLFFLINLYFPTHLEKGLSNFLPHSPGLPCQVGAEGGVLEI